METFLKEINAVLGVMGSFVCLADDSVPAKLVPDQFDGACLGAAARVAVQTFSALETSGQRVMEADLSFGQGRVILKNLRGGILVILCSRNINIPLLNLTANVAAKKIAAELKTIKTPAASAPVPVMHPAANVPAAAAVEHPKKQPAIPAKVSEGSAGTVLAAAPIPLAAQPVKAAAAPAAPSVPASEKTADGTLSPLLAELEQEMRRIQTSAMSERIHRVKLVAMDPMATLAYCTRHRHLLSSIDKRHMDFAAESSQATGVVRLFRQLGYQTDERTNAANGNRRLSFFDSKKGLGVDVHLDSFEMYHRLDLKPSMEIYGTLITETDLLLTRLQWVDMTEPILRELCALFAEHNLTTGPEKDRFDAARIARLCSEDWGWYKTVMMNLDKVVAFAPKVVPAAEQTAIRDRIQRLKVRIESAPKSLRWLTRASIGESVKWYETPMLGRATPRPDMAAG